MIVLRGSMSRNRVENIGTFINGYRGGTITARQLPMCRREMDRCFRRWLLVAGGYWPTANPSDVGSDSDAREAVKALQTDLGVAVDGTWWGITQAALESVLGRTVPEAVPRGGFPKPNWPVDPTTGNQRPPGDGKGELAPPVSAVKKAGIVMASLGVLAVVGAAITAWVMRKRKRA